MANNPMEGRIAEIQFDSGRHFRIDFLPENKLRWTSIRKQDYGVTDVESTHVEILGDGLYSIDWIEKSGLCVSYSVDVNAQFVKSYMSWSDSKGPYGGRDFLTHEGPFFFIQESGERDLRPFTSLEIARSFFTALAAPQPLENAKKHMAETFAFQSSQGKKTKQEFLSALAECAQSGKSCTAKIISAHTDRDTVFIEAQVGSTCEMHVFIINNGLITAYKKFC